MDSIPQEIDLRSGVLSTESSGASKKSLAEIKNSIYPSRKIASTCPKKTWLFNFIFKVPEIKPSFQLGQITRRCSTHLTIQ